MLRLLLCFDTYHKAKYLLYPNHIVDFPNKSDKLSFWQGINYFYFASPNLSK